MPTVPQLCWICRRVATTREHTTNQAIIDIVAGKPTPGDPWFFHDEFGGLNQPLQGLNSKLLKPYVDLCADCNNRLTQPHDKAIERFVNWLNNSKPQLMPGDALQPNDVYATQTKQQMLNLHLYFAKKFGCLITEARFRGEPISVDVAEAARAIRNGRSCPNLYLKFGRRLVINELIARTRPIRHDHNGRFFAVDWVHYYGQYAVELSYVENALPDDPYLVDAWHPRFGQRGLKLLLINRPITIDPSRS